MTTTKNKHGLYIIISVVLLSLIVTCVDAFLKPPYIVKVPIKIVFFLIVPIIYFLLNKSESENFKKLFRLKKRTLIKAIAIGVAIYGVILGGYFLLRGVIDFSNVTNSLQETNGITRENFLYVSLYISLANSFLEEFFFRGFGFITLKAHKSRKFAYIFSSSCFAVYHVGMLMGMFDWWVMPILFIGLFVGGCIFNWLNETSENIYTSWASHMFAKFAINTIGFILFGII